MARGHRRNFRIRLSAKDINEHIAVLRDEKERIRDSAYEDLRHLADFAYAQLMQRIPEDTGELKSSVACIVDRTTLTLRISVGSDHALYVEFGTGVKGEASPHPDSEWLSNMGWKYNVGETIHTRPDGKTGWYYPADNGGYPFTQGQAARHFFYDTIQEVVQEANRMGVRLSFK